MKPFLQGKKPLVTVKINIIPIQLSYYSIVLVKIFPNCAISNPNNPFSCNQAPL